MRKLEILLVLFYVGYHETIIIPETNKFLKYPLYLCEFVRWVGCWFYMACWVKITERRDWWSVTPLVIPRGSPFRFNK